MAYISLSVRIRANSFVVLGPPSAIRAELSWLNKAVADALADEEVTKLIACIPGQSRNLRACTTAAEF